MNLIAEVLGIALAAAPWLLIGFLLAGIIRGLIAEATLQRVVGGNSAMATARAAVIGVPLPLCSCGAIPTAFSLHRSGAGRGPTTSFLVGTPGVGMDSIALTYALLGPFMMVARIAGTVVTAVATGLLVGRSPLPISTTSSEPDAVSDCCSSDSCGQTSKPVPPASPVARMKGGITYAFTELLDDISTWLAIGLVVAGVLVAFFPPDSLAAVGSGLLPMLLMAMVGIPMYLCATAATPIAAAMLLTGVSPGTVLVLLIAGPVTSMATLGVLRQEMGNNALVRYLLAIILTSVLMGWALDQWVAAMDLNIAAQATAAGELMPEWLEWTALAVLLTLVIRPLRQLLWGRLLWERL